MLVPLASLIAGLVAADLRGAVPPGWSLVALAATTLAACFTGARFPFFLSLSALFFCIGGISLDPYLRPAHQLPGPGDRAVVIEGVVDRRPEWYAAGGGKLFLQVERMGVRSADTPVHGRLLVYVKEGRGVLRTGDRILFTSRLREPRAYGLPGERDQVRRLAYQGVFHTGFVLKADDLVLLRGGAGLGNDIDLLATRLGGFIMSLEPGVEGGVLKALLLGDRGDVPEQLQDAYARSGVNHILSISGFHVGIVFLSLFHLLYFLARRSERLALFIHLKQALLILALPVVIFYLFLSGQAPATLRSVLMISCGVAALFLKRELDPVNSIMLAACAILFVSPPTLFEVSFQLSFLAIWGLAVLAPPLAGCCRGKGSIVRWFFLLLSASLAAVVATLVPVAYHFQRVSLIGLVANLVIVPLLGYGAVVSGFAALAASFVAEAPAAWLLHLAAWFVRLSDRIIEYLARAPLITGYLPQKLDLFLACLVLCALTLIRGRVLRLAAVLPLLLILVLRAVPAQSAGDGLLHVYFLSVGQGDASLLQLPDGKWMLVDGGGNATDAAARVGPRLLLPALRTLGVRRIDYLVLSHGHPDHLQGVLYLAGYFEVGEFWESGVACDVPEYRQLQWVLAARGVPLRALRPESGAVAAGGAVLRPLWPREALAADGEDENERSLVFTLGFGKASVLFPGDLGERGERELLSQGLLSRCSLLKVAHHGSRYSSCDPFLAAVRPRVAVVSAGYKNAFRLPAPSTLERLQRHGATVYRTDQEGTVCATLGADGNVEVTLPWGHFN